MSEVSTDTRFFDVEKAQTATNLVILPTIALCGLFQQFDGSTDGVLNLVMWKESDATQTRTIEYGSCRDAESPRFDV